MSMNQTNTGSASIRDIFKEHGAIFNPDRDYLCVQNFGSIENEYHALYNSAGIRLLPDKGIYKLHGTDTLDFLHRITTNETKNLEKNGVTRTIFTNENGRIIDYATLINYGDYLLMTGCPEYEEKLLKWIEKYIIVDDVKVIPFRDEIIIIEILGPKADQFVELLSGNTGNSVDERRLIPVTADNVSFDLIRPQMNDKIHHYWIIVEQKICAELLNSMLDDHLGLEISLIGEEAYEIFRIENGIPSSPNEFNENINPHEAGIISDVSFTKGCYIGQEVIARLDTYDKVQKHLRSIVFHTDNVPDGDYMLYSEDNIRAGHITSLTYSRKIKKTVGLGYIRKSYSKDNTRLKAKIETGNNNKSPESFDVLVGENPV